VLAWILAACLGAALVAIVVVALGWRRARVRLKATDQLVTAAREAVHAAVTEETAAHVEEIRRTLARERADATSQLAADERRAAEERRAELAERERQAADALAAQLAQIEGRLEERLRGFAADLERSSRHLEAQVQKLAQRQQQAIADVESRIETEAAELGSTADEQRKTVHRLREELEHAAGQAVQEALDELESQTLERRRAIEEITERLRTREAAIAEELARAETDVRARLDVILVEWERRQTERLGKVTEREIERHVQFATLQFDERMREVREDAATRLARELDRAVELLYREELVRRIDSGA
jgi:hypothetical protein